MAQHSSCGLTQEQREDILRACGYSYVRTGRGSHTIWINDKLQALGSKIVSEVPANLFVTGNGKPWEIALPMDPAGKTWHRIEKLAQICKGILESRKLQNESDEERKNKLTELKANKVEITRWRKRVKHCLKMSQPVPAAPSCY